MDYVLIILYFSLFLYLCFRWKWLRLEGTPIWLTPALFVLKLIGGIVLWNLYEHWYQGGDLLTLFERAHELKEMGVKKVLSAALGIETNSMRQLQGWTYEWEKSYFNNNRVVIILHALLLYVSNGIYWVHLLLFTFLSLIGLIALAKIFQQHFSSKKWLLVLFFIPTFFLYTSGTTKESLSLFALGLFLYHCFQLLEGKGNWRTYLLLLFSLWLLLLVKTVLILVLVPGFLAMLLLKFTSLKTVWTYLVALLLLLVGAFVFEASSGGKIAQRIHERYKHELASAKGGVYLLNDEHYVYIDSEEGMERLELLSDGTYTIQPGTPLLQWKLDGNMSDTVFIASSKDTTSYSFYQAYPKANSMVEILPLRASLGSVLWNAPRAFITSFFRPNMLEVKNAFQLVSALENVLLFLLFLFAMIDAFKRTYTNPSFWWMLLAALLLFTIIGMSTPVIGAIVRHKVLAYPFLISSIFFLLAEGKWAARLRLR